MAGVLLMAAVGCAPTVDDLELAREAADRGDRAMALSRYSDHLATHPDDYDARVEYTILLGETWAFDGGDRTPILENLELLFAERPDNQRIKELYTMMLVREGQAAAEARRFEDAEALYYRAIDVHPDVGTAHYRLALLYEEWGRPEEALRQYIAAAMKRPPIPDLYLRLGLAYLQRQEYDRAINTLNLVLDLRGTSTYLIPRAECALAQAFAARGEEEIAAEHLRAASDDCVLAPT